MKKNPTQQSRIFLSTVVTRSPGASAVKMAVGPVCLEGVVLVHEHQPETHVFVRLIFERNVGEDDVHVALPHVLFGDRRAETEIRIQRHPEAYICIQVKFRRKFVGEVRHVALLGESPKGSSHETHRLGIGDFERGVECFVPHQALGVKMLAVPRNAVVGNDVDRIDDGVFGSCSNNRRICLYGIFREGKCNKHYC